MKLIIEISDKDYNNIEPFLDGKRIIGGLNLFKALEIIKNGTPLEQAPKTDGDYISRQAVLDGLASIAKAKAKSDAQKSLMGRVMFFVEQLPSVQPKAEQESVIDKIREEVSKAMDKEPAWKGQDNYIGGLQIACSIIDKYRQEG